MPTVVGTGQKKDIEMRVGKSPAGLFSLIRNVLPLATMPEMCEALPAWKALSPAMSVTVVSAQPV